MKALVFALVVPLAACGKPHTPEVATGSGSATGPGAGGGPATAGSAASSVATVGSGSAAGGAPVAGAASPTTGSGSAAGGHGERSEAARTLEGFDRVFAPIWKLEGGAHIRAKCAHTKQLEARLHDLPSEIPGSKSQDWVTARDDLAVLVGELGLHCEQIPKTAFKSDDELGHMGGYFPDTGAMLREAYSRLVAVVPDASPVGAHAGDPMPAADPGAQK